MWWEKKTKYHNMMTIVDGKQFDSKKEAERYTFLSALERVGEISELELQKKFVLIPRQNGERECAYYADFCYKDKNGNFIVEDTKGLKTDVYKIKRKLMLYIHGIKIQEV